jgi:hypothetical protein
VCVLSACVVQVKRGELTQDRGILYNDELRVSFQHLVFLGSFSGRKTINRSTLVRNKEAPYKKLFGNSREAAEESALHDLGKEVFVRIIL